MITTGEGGLITTNKILAKKIIIFKISWNYKRFFRNEKDPDGPWYYEQLELGYNYRMPDYKCSFRN